MPDNQNLDELTILETARLLTDDVDRAAFLDIVCRDKTSLRQRVEQLLDDATAAEAYFGQNTQQEPLPAASSPYQTPNESSPEEAGAVIDSYKLLQKIGEGGYGDVYMAEQQKPVRRRVALKIVKLGMDTKDVVARFEAERQALALMDHPNIAKVFDAGATETGRPYFVMDLVRGLTITEFCDTNRLSNRERLELLLPICSAIQHAHQRGIIHRDIKPSNILVSLDDGKATPKVIDFGIAKATHQKLTDKTLFTRFHQMLGTPAYMSPEQADMSNLDIDTRTDIYSIGVVIYELLVGQAPLDSRRILASGYEEMRRCIREEEPAKPSARFNTLGQEKQTTQAHQRKTSSRIVISQLSGDVDWIVMKALEKDRNRRYATITAFAEDIERYLENLPVKATPPSLGYILSKAWQRNKLLYTAGGAVILSLILGFSVSLWQLKEATVARLNASNAEAEKEKEREAAVQARQQERATRLQAEDDRTIARRRTYAASINLAQKAIEASNVGRAKKLLERFIPNAAHPQDFRDWEWSYLWQFVQSGAKDTLGSLTDWPTSSTISHDGKFAVIAIMGKQGWRLMPLDGSNQLRNLAMDRRVIAADVHPTKPMLALGCVNNETEEKFVEVRELVTDKLIQRLPIELTPWRLNFTPDGKQLIGLVSKDRRVEHLKIWNIDDLDQPPQERNKITITPTYSAMRGLDSSRDGQWIATSGDVGEVLLWGEEPEPEVLAIEGSQDSVNQVAFSPDSSLLAATTCCAETDITIWDLKSRGLFRTLKGHRAWVSRVLFTPDGERLITASADRTIRIWDFNTGEALSVLHGHKQEIWTLDISPNGDELISGDKTGTFLRWDLNAHSARTYESEIQLDVEKGVFYRGSQVWAFAENGQSIVEINHKGKVYRHHGPHFEKRTTLLDLPTRLINARISPAGDQILFFTDTKTVEVWDVLQGVLLRALNLEQGLSMKGDIGALFFHDNAQSIVIVDSNEELSVWKVATGEKMATLDASDNYSFLAPPQGDYLVYIDRQDQGEQTLVSVDFKGEELGRYSSGRFLFNTYSFTQKGNLLSIPHSPGLTEIWDVPSLKLRSTLQGHLLGEKAAAFSPNAKRLATGSSESESAKIWDWETGEELLTLGSDLGLVTRIQFSPDGAVLGASDIFGKLHFWFASGADADPSAPANTSPSPP